MGKKRGGVRVKQVGPKQPAMPINPMEALQIPQDEMVHLPPAPNRSYQFFWPTHETFSMDTNGFQIIYPSYLDSKKTLKEGRRIGADKALPTPSVADISQGLQSLQVRHVVQPYKGYSRDISCQWDNPGRVKVDVSKFTKKELLLELAERIRDLPERILRIQREDAQRRNEEEERAAAIAAAASAAKTAPKKAITSGASNKKKGKKGKRK